MAIDILIDFDGSVVTHDYPLIGKDIGAVPVLKKLVEAGNNLILFTMRSDKPVLIENSNFDTGLSDAVKWFEENEIPLYGVQTNPTQSSWTSSPKAHGQLIIDDIGLNMPLKKDLTLSTRPFIDWIKVEELLQNLNLIN